MPNREGLLLSVLGGKGSASTFADRVDRRVPGQPVAVRLQRRPRVVVEPGVLDVRVGKRLGDAAVERGARVGVDPVAAVVALQVDDVDGAGRSELGHDLVRPAVARVHLEAQGRGELEPRADVAAGRDDEGQRPRLAADGLGDRLSSLSQREVERGALVGPARVVVVDSELVQPRGEGRERPLAGERQYRSRGGRRVVDLWLVVDVLAKPLLARAPEVDDRRLPCEPPSPENESVSSS